VPAASASFAGPPLPALAAAEELSPAPVARAYAAGQWVCGERFCGREALLGEVLAGQRNGIWLLGSRAIGKTSTLKQLEHLTDRDRTGALVPLFWDLQGCEQPADLDAGFAGALADAEERLLACGVATAELAAAGFLAALGRLRRSLRGAGRTLLLLVDEAEELIALERRSPSLLRKLRSALLAHEGVRTVLAASSRLWQLAEGDGDTSPFLHGFAPPLYLGPLDDEAARRLVRRGDGAGAPTGGRDDVDVAELLRRAGNHPYLLQLLCTRLLETGDLESAAAQVAADAGVRHLFAVDEALLSPLERRLAARIAAAVTVSLPLDDPAASPADVATALLHLERLGVVRSDGTALVIAGTLLADWHRARRPQLEAVDERQRDGIDDGG
jgi:hypothetical protein